MNKCMILHIIYNVELYIVREVAVKKTSDGEMTTPGKIENVVSVLGEYLEIDQVKSSELTRTEEARGF